MSKDTSSDKFAFKRVVKYKKRIRCAICGKSIFIKNFNQKKCNKCGYRDKHKDNLLDYIDDEDDDEDE
jgi:ribosomal protein L37E